MPATPSAVRDVERSKRATGPPRHAAADQNERMPGRGGVTPNSGFPEELLVGRDALVDEIVATAVAATTGRGSIVLLTGEAGIGKTSVARAVARRVREQLTVSWGACVADQGAPPFWPWRELVEAGPSLQPPGGDDVVGAPRFEQLSAFRDHVRLLALAEPRLHVIEDLQWADVASVLLLAHLGAVIADTPLLVVATVRAGEPRSSQLDDAIEQVRRIAHVRPLPPLGDADIAALIRGAGAEPDERLVTRIRTRTDGNPLFVAELLRSVPVAESAQRRLELVTEHVPDRVTDLVEHRLGRLPAPVADAIATAAVMGAEGDVAPLAAANGSDVEALLDLLDQARAAHVLDAVGAARWRFRHQMVRDAVYEHVTGGDRARRHARVVEALAADASVPPPVVAHHALAAVPLFDADRAVALAARAGESAFALHAYEEAVEWFTRALAAAPAETTRRWRAELLLLTGEAHRHIGDRAAAREAFVHAAELTDEPGLLARAALGYADPGADLGIAYRTDDIDAATLLDRALAAQPPRDALTMVQLEARLAAELYFSDHPARARALAQSALERARRLDDPRALGIATAVVHDAFVVGQTELDRQLEESARLLEWSRASASIAASLTAHRARVFDLLAAGELADMDAEILAFQRIAEPLQLPAYRWWPALWSAMRALLEGRHDVAEQRGIAAYEIGASAFPSLAFLNLSFLMFFLRREQGRLAEVEQATRDYAAAYADVPALRVGLTFLLAELGRVDEVRGALGAFDDAALDRLHDRNWPASWFQLARAAHVVGDRDLASALLGPKRRPSERCVQVSLATVCLGATDLATAWLSHTIGDLDGADAHYRSAEALNARIGARCWLAQAWHDHACLLRERDHDGDREVSAQLLDRAQRAATEIGLATIVPAGRAAPPAARTARFHRTGTVWELAFADRVVQLPDARGLRDLAYLVGRPGIAVSVLELSDDIEPSTTRGAPALDEQARREIRERLRQLDADEADAEATGDGERAAIAREQRQALSEMVARDFGLGGRARRVGDPVERARKTVSTRIRRTIATIGRAHPELGRHLERSVDTGTWCAYRPAEPVDWQT
jgi:tetratricopeptide (TPR) repeat protein